MLCHIFWTIKIKIKNNNKIKNDRKYPCFLTQYKPYLYLFIVVPCRNFYFYFYRAGYWKSLIGWDASESSLIGSERKPFECILFDLQYFQWLSTRIIIMTHSSILFLFLFLVLHCWFNDKTRFPSLSPDIFCLPHSILRP